MQSWWNTTLWMYKFVCKILYVLPVIFLNVLWSNCSSDRNCVHKGFQNITSKCVRIIQSAIHSHSSSEDHNQQRNLGQFEYGDDWWLVQSVGAERGLNDGQNVNEDKKRFMALCRHLVTESCAEFGQLWNQFYIRKEALLSWSLGLNTEVRVYQALWVANDWDRNTF